MHDDWADKGAEWVRNERTVDASFAPFTEVLLTAADLGSTRRVLDVGCGSGTMLAAAATSGARAVGIDVSPAMVDAARRRVPDVSVVAADAQTADLASLAPGEPFDRVVSRFGVMFFDDPVAAFANIRAATARGARLAFVCWRADEREMFTLGLDVLAGRLGHPVDPPVAGTPGPLGLADASHIDDVLSTAGWVDVAIEPFEAVCDYGLDGSDGVEERLSMAAAGNVGRAVRAELEPRLGPGGWEIVLDEIRAELRSRLVDGVVRFIGHIWVVTATNPGDASSVGREA